MSQRLSPNRPPLDLGAILASLHQDPEPIRFSWTRDVLPGVVLFAGIYCLFMIM